MNLTGALFRALLTLKSCLSDCMCFLSQAGSIDEDDLGGPTLHPNPQIQTSRPTHDPGESDGLDPDEHTADLTTGNTVERILITHICATNVAIRLRRIPVGFCVAVKSEIGTMRTSNKPVSMTKDMVEWDDRIVLPSARSSRISFTVFATFELGPTLGNGEALCEFEEFTVGQLLDHEGRFQLIRPAPQSEGEDDSSPLSCEVEVERRVYGDGEYMAMSSSLESEETRRLGELTDMGHHALTHFRECQEQSDLDESIKYFECALGECPPNHLHRAIVLFNLAAAKLIRYRVHDAPADLDMSIDLYLDALHLRPLGHPDRPSTLFGLGVALKARFQKQHDEADETEGRFLLSQVLDIVATDSHAYHAASLALGSAAPSEDFEAMRNSEGGQRLGDVLQKVFHENSRGHAFLDHLRILFGVRFNSLSDLDDPEMVISALEPAVQSAFNDHSSGRSPETNLLLWILRGLARLKLMENAIPLPPGNTLFTHPESSGGVDLVILENALNNLGYSLLTRYEHSGDVADLERSISVYQDTAMLAPDKLLKKSQLRNFGVSLYIRYERFGNVTDLERSISMLEGAVNLTPDGDPDKPSILDYLGNSLLLRCRHSRDVTDLERLISVLEEAVKLTPDDHPSKPSRLNNLGTSLFTRYKRIGDVTDLERSISVREDVVKLTPDEHPERPSGLNNLGSSLLIRYERFGDVTDLERSISMREDSVKLAPDGHPDKPSRLNNLGNSLSIHYERFGDVTDLERSTSVREDAIKLTPDGHPSKPSMLNNLGHSLFTRYKRFGDVTDLEKSISVFEDVVKLTPDGHPSKPSRLSNFGNSLSIRYEHFGDVTGLERSVSVFENAAKLTPDGHPEKPSMLNNIGTSLLARYECFGDVTNLERSISVREDAVKLTPDGHPEKPSWLNNLGFSLLTRFKRFRDVTDLERSISVQEDAVKLTPDGHPDKPSRLNNLGISLSYRYERFKDVTDLERSISVREDAVKLTPDGHPAKPSRLNNLGISLSSRYERIGDGIDLERSISVFKDAVKLTPDGHPNKPSMLSNLGNSLLTRFKRFGDVTDLERSISGQEDAVQLTPDGHVDQSPQLNNLTRSLLARFQYSGGLSSSDVSQAILYSSRAARFQPGLSVDRFEASQLWVQSIRLLGHDPQSLVDPYTIAVELLPQLAWLGLSLPDRYHQLLRATDSARDATAAALDVNRPGLAVEWLEQGRSVVWSQLSQLRTPVDDLRIVYPELAAQFEHVSRALEQAGNRNGEIHSLHQYAGGNVEEGDPAQRRWHTMALSRERLLAEIRALPSFERFLLPKTIAQLSPLAHSGPVVFLNASKYRCDALVVMAGSEHVIHVPLSQIKYDEIQGMQARLNRLLEFKGRVTLRDDSDRAATIRGMIPDDVFRSILASLWEKVVSPILEVLPPSTSDSKLRRIFWCPTGPFSFLPIHAAGVYGATDPGSGPKLTDVVVSSYIPTMSALELPPREEPKTTSHNIRLLAVPQPGTDGQKLLGGVRGEIETIKNLATSSPFVGFQEADGTVKDVLSRMTETDWVHFACHGIQDRTNPYDSGFPLAHGEHLKLTDIARLSRPHGGLAFLSACHTAAGDKELSDEAIHIAGGMLLAGYRGVIATMWSIMDNDAPKVTEGVYERLFSDGRIPDSRNAAEALHEAVGQLRASGASFLSWVPFIHVGL